MKYLSVLLCLFSLSLRAYGDFIEKQDFSEDLFSTQTLENPWIEQNLQNNLFSMQDDDAEDELARTENLTDEEHAELFEEQEVYFDYSDEEEGYLDDDYLGDEDDEDFYSRL